MSNASSLNTSFEESNDGINEFSTNKFTGALSPTQLKNLMEKTNNSKKEIEAFRTSFLKDFPSGKLNKKQFFQIYKKCDDKISGPNNFCEHIFRAFDADGDGSISFSEFLIGVSMPSMPRTKQDLKAKLEWLFKIYDINGDGLIDKEEVQIVIDSFYQLLDKSDGLKTTPLIVQSHIHANEIFEKLNLDKKMFITIEQFTNSCIKDYGLLNLFAPNYTRKL